MLSTGDYKIRLEGMDKSGEYELIEIYKFRIEKK
jgi:hypothetical protein